MKCRSSITSEGVDQKIVDLLNIWTGRPHLEAWEDVVEKMTHPAQEVCIAIVGKYVNLTDSYKSLNEALVHGGIANNCRVQSAVCGFRKD